MEQRIRAVSKDAAKHGCKYLMTGDDTSNTARVLRLASSVPPLPGGMEQHVRRLTDEQRGRGWRVDLLFCSGDRTHEDDLCLSLGRWVIGIRPQSLRSMVFLLLAIPTLIHRIGKIDVVHVHGDWSMVLAGRIAKWILGAAALVASVHGGPMDSRVRASLQRWALGMADMVHTTGRRDADRIRKYALCPVLWQPSGVHDDYFGAGHGRVPTDLMRGGRATVVSTAVLRPMKNIGLLLDIAALLPEVNFVVVGAGPELQRLEAKRARMGLDNVRFEGMQERGRVIAYLDGADLFLCTSYVEGTPTSVLEAMCRGLPIVTSDCSDFRDIVDDANGRIVGDFRAESFREMIGSVLADRKRWAAMSQISVDRVSGLAWGLVAERVSASISDVIAKRDRS